MCIIHIAGAAIFFDKDKNLTFERPAPSGQRLLVTAAAGLWVCGASCGGHHHHIRQVFSCKTSLQSVHTLIYIFIIMSPLPQLLPPPQSVLSASTLPLLLAPLVFKISPFFSPLW